jgi:hypothetical protein
VTERDLASSPHRCPALLLSPHPSERRGQRVCDGHGAGAPHGQPSHRRALGRRHHGASRRHHLHGCVSIAAAFFVTWRGWRTLVPGVVVCCVLLRQIADCSPPHLLAEVACHSRPSAPSANAIRLPAYKSLPTYLLLADARDPLEFELHTVNETAHNPPADSADAGEGEVAAWLRPLRL